MRENKPHWFLPKLKRAANLNGFHTSSKHARTSVYHNCVIWCLNYSNFFY